MIIKIISNAEDHMTYLSAFDLLLCAQSIVAMSNWVLIIIMTVLFLDKVVITTGKLCYHIA